MGEQRDAVQLRPLSIGEIFDRAITLLVRHWQPFFIIGAICILPRELFAYLQAAVSPAFGLALLVATLLVAAAGIAIPALVAQIYRNEPLHWTAALVQGLQRIPGALGVALTVILMALLPLLIIVGIPTDLGVFHFGNPLADVAAILSGAAGLAIVLGAIFSLSYASAAMGIDDCAAMDSVGRALSLFRQSSGRLFLYVIAQEVIAVGGAFAGGAVAGIVGVLSHSLALQSALEALVVLVVTVLADVLIGVYYFDVAVRQEGYDMQVALEAMPG